MRRQLIEEGFIRVFYENERKALQELVNKLKGEGHAVVCDEVFMDGKVTSMSAHHYKTCEACKRVA